MTNVDVMFYLLHGEASHLPPNKYVQIMIEIFVKLRKINQWDFVTSTVNVVLNFKGNFGLVSVL